MADPPSRFYSDIDYALSTPTWNLVDKAFSPHSFDLMALPLNVKKSRNGCNLKFYPPSHFNESSRVNVFAQSRSPSENYYVFPPFILLGALLKRFNPISPGPFNTFSIWGGGFRPPPPSVTLLSLNQIKPNLVC